MGLDSAAVDGELYDGQYTGVGDKQGSERSYGETTDQEDDDLVQTFTLSGSEARVEHKDFRDSEYIDGEET